MTSTNTSDVISHLRSRGWVVEGPRLDYLDDDLAPPDLPDVKVMGYRVQSPKMSQSYHTAKPISVANMIELERWVLAGAMFSYSP